MKEKTFSEHLEDLRILILRLLMVWGGGALLTSFWVSPIMTFLLAPYGSAPRNFLLLSPLEGWWTAFFVALLAGTLLALPLILFFFVSYLLPALYPEESKKIGLIGGSIFFFSSVGFCVGHFFFAPLIIHSLESVSFVPGIAAYAMREALHFVVAIDLGVILLFNLIGGLLLAVIKGWLSVERLVAWRKPFILGAFIISAILTPPDILSQVLMAIGLILGYEAVILLGRVNAVLYGPSRDDRFRRDSDATDLPQGQSYLTGPEIPL